MTPAKLVPLIAGASLLFTGACAYDGAIGYAPTDYPPGYDSGMGSGLANQPGDLFGGQNVASVAVFEAPLAPYGQWVNSRYGRAFRPDVQQDWRPYVNGQWGENRLWVSNDPWGWATDHYGRWGFDEQIGWVWTPGTEWAPSWVAFRDDPAQNIAGWAPIPPNINYSLNYGFGFGGGYDNFASWYAPSWVWVPRSYLYQPGFGGRVLPWRYGANYWGGSAWQYQPGWGGRPRIGGGNAYRPSYGNRPNGNVPNGNWQTRPQPPRGQFGQRQPADGQIGRRPVDGRQWNNIPQGAASGAEQGQFRRDGEMGLRRADRGNRGFGGRQAPPGGVPPAMREAGGASRPIANNEAQQQMRAPRAERPMPQRAERAERQAQRSERVYDAGSNPRPE